MSHARTRFERLGSKSACRASADRRGGWMHQAERAARAQPSLQHGVRAEAIAGATGRTFGTVGAADGCPAATAVTTPLSHVASHDVMVASGTSVATASWSPAIFVVGARAKCSVLPRAARL